MQLNYFKKLLLINYFVNLKFYENGNPALNLF